LNVGIEQLENSRKMTTHEAGKYIDVYQDLVSNYNSSIHSTTKEKPINILKGVRTNKQPFKKVKNLRIGQKVRTLLQRSVFSKAEKPRWSKSHYEIMGKELNGYKLKNLKTGVVLKRTYKLFELLLIEGVLDFLFKKLDAPEQEKVIKKHRIVKDLKREGIEESNVVKSKRKRIKPKSSRTFEIDSLVKPVLKDSNKMYEVKWSGYKETTLEPRDILLEDAKQLVEDFDKEHGVRWLRKSVKFS